MSSIRSADLDGPSPDPASSPALRRPICNHSGAVPDHLPTVFIFANLNGSISAWNGSAGTTAVTEWSTPGAAYIGLAINQANTLLYAANGAGGGGIDVLNSAFAPAALPAGAFATPTAIKTAGLVPFNVKDINGAVYLTYASSGHAAQTGATKGMGALAVFNEDRMLESGSFIADELASP